MLSKSFAEALPTGRASAGSLDVAISMQFAEFELFPISGDEYLFGCASFCYFSSSWVGLLLCVGVYVVYDCTIVPGSISKKKLTCQDSDLKLSI